MKLSKHHFWNWFSRHHPEYSRLNNKPKAEFSYWLNEMNAHLRAYFKFLNFSFEWKPTESILTITVNGMVNHFKKVDALVAIAPAIQGWKFVALECPRPIDFDMERQFADTCIDPREFRFSIDSKREQGFFVTVYHPLCTEDNNHLIYDIAHAAMYNLLGERSFGMNIAGLKVANLSTAVPDAVEALEELPRRIGEGKTGMMVDDRGNLLNT